MAWEGAAVEGNGAAPASAPVDTPGAPAPVPAPAPAPAAARPDDSTLTSRR